MTSVGCRITLSLPSRAEKCPNVNNDKVDNERQSKVEMMKERIFSFMLGIIPCAYVKIGTVQ